MRPLRAVSAICAASVALSACAEGPVVREERLSREEYVALVEKTQMRITDASALMIGRAAIEGPGEAPADDILDGVEAATDDLEAERPPKEWEDEHADLVSGLREWKRGLATVADAQKTGNTSAFDKGTAQVEAAERTIRAATERLIADVEQDEGAPGT